MRRTIGLVGFSLLLLASPASALTSKQKMETCKFGADDQKLKGAKRNAFITKCMSNKNDQRGPATAAAPKKPVAKKPMAEKPADAAPVKQY